MKEFQNNLEKIIKSMGFDDFSMIYDSENKRFSIYINEDTESFKKILPAFVSSLNTIARLIVKKDEEGFGLIDINGYKKERESIILELARGAAKKAATTKEEVVLPAMNGYERRLVHLELSTRPDVKTESAGEGRDRCVTIKPL